MKRGIMFLSVLVGAALAISLAQAQDQGAGGGGRGQTGSGRHRDHSAQDQGQHRGNWDPAQMRERWMGSIKEQLGASDDEWKVLTPKVAKVMDLQRDMRGGSHGFSGRDRRDRGSSASSDQPVSKVAQAQRDLSTALENKSAATEEITKKLAAYRDAREKARAELQTAQKALKELLTPRQEAVLVVSGMVD